MTRIIGTFNLYHALKAEGFPLPDELVDLELLSPLDGIFQLRYVVNLTDDDVAKLGRALVVMGERRVK